MESFDRAYTETMRIEFGYVNDTDDPGGETYNGISRRYHPDWLGWFIVDEASDKTQLRDNVKLKALVRQFYYNEFWRPLRCDELPPEIAAELFDTAVNVSERKAVKILQKSLNILNRNEKLYPDLKVDGSIGPVTIGAVELVKPHRLLKCLNGFQFMHYAGLYEARPNLEKFAGWVDRT